MTLPHSRLLATVTIAALGAAVLVGCSSNDPVVVEAVGTDGDMEALVTAAQAEGALTIYDGGSEAKVRRWADAFSAEYSIDVTIVRDGDAALYERYSQEEAAGQSQADVITLIDRAAKEEAVDNEWFAEYTPQEADALPTEYARDGYYYPMQGKTAQVIAYNTNNVTDAEIEGLKADPWAFISSADLTGRIGVGEVVSKDDMALWYMYTEGDASADYGWDAAQGIADNTYRVISGSTNIAQSLVQGEIDFGFSLPDTYVTTLISRDNAPLGFVYPDPTIATTNATAVNAGAPHPNAARLFVEWAASPGGVTAWSQGADQQPIRSDVTDPRTFLDEPWYSERPDTLWEDAENDADFNRAMSEDGDFRQRWNEIFGFSG